MRTGMVWRRQKNGRWTRQYYRAAGPITFTEHVLWENYLETILANFYRESPLLGRIGKSMPAFHGGSTL